MDVCFETQSGSSFSIELGYWDTTLEIKEKIERYKGIPVSKQTLSFNGIDLEDDLDVQQCDILHNSRLQIVVSPLSNPNHNSDQVLHQTKKSSPVPSNSVGDIIYGQDLPLTTQHSSNIQAFWPVTSEEISKIRDSPVRNNDQAVLQTEQSPPSNSTEKIIKGHQDSTLKVHGLQTEESPPSNSTEKIINGHKDSTLKVQVLQTEQSPPSNSTEKIINGHQDSTLKVQVLQPEESPPSNSVKEIINTPRKPVKKWSKKKVSKRIEVGSKNNNDQVLVKMSSNNKNDQVLQTEKSPPSNSTEQMINGHQDSTTKVRSNNKNDQVLKTQKSPPSNLNKDDHSWKPVSVRKIVNRMTVKVLLHSGESKPARKVLVCVNSRDKVKELRKELVKIEESGQLRLPEEGYSFVHKHHVMDEDQSFLSNNVYPVDTIEVFPANVPNLPTTNAPIAE